MSCIDEYPIKYRGPFSFLNDSIILYFHSYKKEILFINYIKNKVIKSIKLKDNLTFSSYDDIQINFKDSVLRMPAMSNQYIDNDYFNNSFVGLDVDLSKDSIKKRFNYPSNSGLTANHEFSLLKPEAIFLENKVVLNFQSLDKLYVFHDSINAYIEYINPGQNIINNKQYVFNEDMDIERKLLIEFSGLYKRLIYDDLKDLYYRIMITYPDFDGRIPSSREKLNRIIASRKTTVSVMNGGFKEIACNSISGVSDFMCFASDGKLYMLEDDKVNTDDLESFIGFDLTDL